MILENEWSPIAGLILEPNAKSAATTLDHNVVVAAGPGAGKTELLAQRADFLFRTGNCPYPRRILAVSFTVSAARNLRERVRLRSGDAFAARLDSLTFHAFAKRIIDNYRVSLSGYNRLEADYRIDPSDRIEGVQIRFEDLVPLALEILDTNEFARASIRQTYTHVFLDEFQDATQHQYALIRKAFRSSTTILTAVGDVKQRIMAWAGALDGVMETFASDFSAKSLPLYQNFRSAPRLRRMQNRMIEHIDPSSLIGQPAITGDRGDISVLSFKTDQDEADFLAHQVQQWLEQGTKASEIGILVRQQPDLVCQKLLEALSEREIPWRNEQKQQDLIADPIASLILDYFRVIALNHQVRAYTDLMQTVSHPGILDTDANRREGQLKRIIHEARTCLHNSPELETDPEFWDKFADKLVELVSLPVLSALSPSYQQGSRLSDAIREVQESFRESLVTYGNAADALSVFSETDAIRLLTIHKCKGLEFEKVIVLGVEKELFWSGDSWSEFFVAISRAKESLMLTHADIRERPSGFSKYWSTRRSAYEEFLEFAGDED